MIRSLECMIKKIHRIETSHTLLPYNPTHYKSLNAIYDLFLNRVLKYVSLCELIIYFKMLPLQKLVILSIKAQILNI